MKVNKERFIDWIDWIELIINVRVVLQVAVSENCKLRAVLHLIKKLKLDQITLTLIRSNN